MAAEGEAFLETLEQFWAYLDAESKRRRGLGKVAQQTDTCIRWLYAYSPVSSEEELQVQIMLDMSEALLKRAGG